MHKISFTTRGDYRFRNQSLKDIVLYLGINELRRFVLVACLTSFETVRTAEIYYLSLIRAKFCELLAGRSTSHQLSSEAFMVGLFSLLDVILETPMN
jgi:EAL and modified HD-GYP domain-containing signal transduction protein